MAQVKIPLYLVITILFASMSAVWLLQDARLSAYKEQASCIYSMQEQVTSNTRRIEAIEKAVDGLPADLAEIKTDLKYIKQQLQDK